MGKCVYLMHEYKHVAEFGVTANFYLFTRFVSCFLSGTQGVSMLFLQQQICGLKKKIGSKSHQKHLWQKRDLNMDVPYPDPRTHT